MLYINCIVYNAYGNHYLCRGSCDLVTGVDCDVPLCNEFAWHYHHDETLQRIISKLCKLT